MMELLSSESHYILASKSDSLWINRKTCTFTHKSGVDVYNGSKCLGVVYGFVGKLDFSDNSEQRLVFIKKRELVGELRGCQIFKICAVISVPLETDVEISLDPCPIIHDTPEESVISLLATESDPFPMSATEANEQRNVAKVRSVPVTFAPSTPKRTERIGKVDKKVLDEFHKMFTEADSFYYSMDYDMTNTIQRTFAAKNCTSATSADPPKFTSWQQADSRFIWNIFMIADLLQSEDSSLKKWILPIIQGSVQYEACEIENLFDHVGPDRIVLHGHLELWLISRRSRYRAGTRYRRRGIDANGKTANYVETEQIIIFNSHIISFVQTRGSIPIFWSQPGFRYRPHPRIEKSLDESFVAFKKHIEEEETIYGPLYLVSLVDRTGKEKILGDSFMEMVLRINSSDLAYITFDFHDNCRGMHFEHVATLINDLMNTAKDMNYCWIDSYGVVLRQRGICRINCVDCLDRTNVVQTHLAKHMMCTQLSKLGLLAPEIGLPENVKKKFQTMWANNGDLISKQYAGTNALKGDYTRTGERRFAGALKDGMNSANRYYLNRFKDAYRQAAIDAMLGTRRNFTEDYLDAAASAKPGDERENTAEQIKSLIEDTRKSVVPKFDPIMGSWGLINAKNNEPDAFDIDIILILTEKHYYVTEYDCNADVITDTQKIRLNAIESIELGYDKLTQPTNVWSIFHQGGTAQQVSTVPCLRINYKTSGESCFHQFRSSNIAFNNNAPIQIEHPEDMHEILKTIAVAIQCVAKNMNHSIPVEYLAVLPNKENVSSKPSIHSAAASWVHRYIIPGSSENSDTDAVLKKPTTASFERFTPKYFRRGSENGRGKPRIFNIEHKREADKSEDVTDDSGKADESKENMENLIPPLKVISPPNYLCASSNDAESVLGASSTFTDLQQLPSDSAFGYLKSNDLVLSSCGLISVPNTSSLVQSPCISLSPSPVLFPPTQLTIPPLGVGLNEGDNSTPSISASFSPSRYDFPSPTIDSGINKDTSGGFARHRNSLPTHSLSPGLGLCHRPITPEIRITEEGPMSDIGMGKSLAVTPNLKRISKSSEDVTKALESKTSATLAKNVKILPGNSNLSLAPGLESGARSSSFQDLSGTALNMKVSHSENTLSRDTRVQGVPQPTIASSTTRKGLNFAPLGKLARGMQNLGTQYFDPRKLRDTFKPQNARNQIETMTKEEKEELRILEERKSSCKSIIIEL